MAGRSIILYAGSGGYILQETTAAVVNIRTQLCFVVIAGHNVITLFKHQRGRAAGIPGRYIIPIAFICALYKVTVISALTPRRRTILLMQVASPLFEIFREITQLLT